MKMLNYLFANLLKLYPFSRGQWRIVTNLLSGLEGFSLRKDKIGNWLLLNLSNPIDRSIFVFGQFEGKEIAKLISYAVQHKPTVFIDVGANIGIYSLSLARCDCIQSVYSFEPNPKNRSQLCANISMNQMETKIKVFDQGLSDKEGFSDFQLCEGMSRLPPFDSNDLDVIRINVDRLDNIIQLKDQSIIVKMDIEGHEKHALKGMRELLTSNKIFLQIEIYEENAADVIPILNSYEFTELPERSSSGMDRYFKNYG